MLSTERDVKTIDGNHARQHSGSAWMLADHVAHAALPLAELPSQLQIRNVPRVTDL